MISMIKRGSFIYFILHIYILIIYNISERAMPQSEGPRNQFRGHSSLIFGAAVDGTGEEPPSSPSMAAPHLVPP